MKYFALLFLLISAALLTSCDDNDPESRQITFTAAMPTDDWSASRPSSILNGVPEEDDFNLVTQWHDGDKIRLFVRQGDKVYQVESPATIYDISSDGKTCSFQFTLPKSVKTDRDYDIFGVVGLDVIVDGEDVIALCGVKRVGVDRDGAVSLPIWFTSKKGTSQVKFRHLFTYEVLYVNNSTGSSMKFKHQGFDVGTPWYKYNEKIVLNNTSKYAGIIETKPDAESDEITIDAWDTGVIVSWYIPAHEISDVTTDIPIDNAKLRAVVNGSVVRTTDALKSYKKFSRGTPYYMQVTWDGKNLYFSNDFCPDGNHPHIVDMGLPSGTKWACCNVGSDAPSQRGDFFAWGETSPRSSFSPNYYKWYSGGDSHKILKYNQNSAFGTVDNRAELEPADDAAYVNWGPEWRMPKLMHFYELIHNCTIEWVKVNGTAGYVFKSQTNDNALFFPLTGWNPRGARAESIGTYYSRDNDDERPDLAICLALNYVNSMVYLAYLPRYMGTNIRAIKQ